jgi:hypothetical protein
MGLVAHRFIVLLVLLASASLTGCVITTQPASQSNEPTQPARHRRAHRPQASTAPGPAATTSDDFVGASTLPPQPPRETPTRSALRPVALTKGAAVGRPPGFAPDAPPAYFIWQGPRGGWRLRTTSGDASHLFRGHIASSTGPITNIEPSRLELRDRIWPTDDGWAFSFRTGSHADGFTFTIPDGGCATFDLGLDGGPVPKRVFVGRRQIEPASGHFVVCPADARDRR